MAKSNRYQQLLENMLVDIRESDELLHFVRWRRAKGKALAMLEKGETSHPYVCDFRDDWGNDDEQRLLDYVAKGIVRIGRTQEQISEMAQDHIEKETRKQIKRRVSFLKKMKKINNRRVKNDLKGKYDLKPLVEHGWTCSIDTLITFYDELGQLQKSSRPRKFVKRTKDAFDRDSLSGIVKIGKAEQLLYGDLAGICRKFEFNASKHDYTAAVNHRERRATWRKRFFYGTFGMTILGAIAMPVALTFFTQKSLLKQEEISDALADEVALYIEEDHLVESDLELQLERTYGFGIVGDFTQEDLEDIQSRLENGYPPEMVSRMGLSRIVIFEDGARSQVDYIGLASGGEQWIRLFSGHIGAYFDHEASHLLTFMYAQKGSDVRRRWEDCAGPYGINVTFTQGPPERGSIATNAQYISGVNRNDPSDGHMRAYGGVNYREDISTYVQAIRGNPLSFAQVTGGFHIYRGKLGLLREYYYISNQEYTDAMGLVQVAEDGGNVEPSSDGPPEVEQCTPAPEAL